MTDIDVFPMLTPERGGDPAARVPLDLYRDIHKGLRAELFGLVTAAGSADAGDAASRAELADHVRRVIGFLDDHAEHEDHQIHPVLEARLPALYEGLTADHADLDARLERIQGRADEAATTSAEEARARVHNLYLDIASFTSAYLAHQETEERVVMPALFDAIGPEETLALHQAIVGSIPPDEMGTALAFMLPAMDIDDRAELLGGMKAGAPPEVFAGVWGLAGSVLDPDDHRALALRLGLA